MQLKMVIVQLIFPFLFLKVFFKAEISKLLHTFSSHVSRIYSYHEHIFKNLFRN